MELSFGEQIKILLRRKNMTIRELAESIEIMTGKKMSRQNLTQRLTRDNFQEQDMRMIASVLGCTLKLSLVEGVPEEVGQVVAPKRQVVDLQKAVDHQLTIEDVIKAAGEETLLEEAEEKARQKALEAEAARPQPRRVTARDLANKAREERLRREAQLAAEARREMQERENEIRVRGRNRLAEEAKLAEEARNREMQRLEPEVVVDEPSPEEKEQIRDIARRALEATRTKYHRFGPAGEDRYAREEQEAALRAALEAEKAAEEAAKEEEDPDLRMLPDGWEEAPSVAAEASAAEEAAAADEEKPSEKAPAEAAEEEVTEEAMEGEEEKSAEDIIAAAAKALETAADETKEAEEAAADEAEDEAAEIAAEAAKALGAAEEVVEEAEGEEEKFTSFFKDEDEDDERLTPEEIENLLAEEGSVLIKKKDEETLLDAAYRDSEAGAALRNTADMGVVPETFRRTNVENRESAGEIDPRTGEEYESNVVRNHPKLTGYIQVYDREAHKWIDMTEWAFLGFQERKKILLGPEYKPPIYLE